MRDLVLGVAVNALRCWSCDAAVEPGAETCPACGKLQPPRATDYFAYLGLPRTFSLDAERLSEILRERSRTLHPDRFARAEARERSLSLQHTTFLNDAVRTLRDPQRRAEYLLGLNGLKAGANDRERAKVEPAFLMEMMERREELADARAAGDAAKLAEIGAGARAERERLMKEAETKFAAWERAPQDRAPLEAVVPILDKVRYFEQMVAEAAGQHGH